MNEHLTLLPSTQDNDTLALELGRVVLHMVLEMQYGVVEVHVHAGDLHKIREVRDFKVPDSLKMSQSARRREQRPPL